MAYSEKQVIQPDKHSNLTLQFFAWAGIVGPIVYILLYTIAGFLRPDYSPIREAISNLGAVGPYAWVQNVNFLVTGLLLFAFAIGFFQQMRLLSRRRWVIVSTLLLGLTGAGLTIVAFFPTDIPGFPPTSFHGLMHDILFFVVFIPLLIALITTGWQLRKIQGWQGFGWYTFITGVAMLGLFITLAALSKSEVAGLMQRIFEIEPFTWCMVMGWRFLKLESLRRSS